jgi:gluconokinase
VIASGSALLNSPASVQMMADALGRAVTVCIEPEPAARGAALLALEHTGGLSSLDALPASMGGTFQPREYQRAAYDALAARERALLQKLS